MKKYFKYYAICWAVALATFNIITFTVANATLGLAALNVSFWVGYAFITAVLIGHLICSILFFKQNNKDTVFLNVSVMRLTYAALAVSAIAGVMAMAIPFIPYWVGIVVDVLILAYYTIAITKASAAVEAVRTKGQKVEQKTSFIKTLSVDASALQSRAQSDDAKALTKKVYEAIRYSDPVSTQELNGVNSQIQCEFDLFTNAITDGNDEAAKSAAAEVCNLIEYRNQKCKALK